MPLIQYLSRISFDFGAIATLGDEIARLGLERPLLVTDEGVAHAGILELALDAAKPSEFFDDAATTEKQSADVRHALGQWSRHPSAFGAIAYGEAIASKP